MDLLELIIVAIMQGVVEWMPISSEGQVVLVVINLLKIDLVTAVSLALFLHLGTMAVVLVVFRKEFIGMVWYVFPVNDNRELDMLDNQPVTYRYMFGLLVTITVGTAITAIPSILFVEDIWNEVAESTNIPLGELATFLIGLLLIVTGVLLYLQKKKASDKDERKLFEKLSITSAFILGLFQGFAAIPGISRSGITITVLLFMNLQHSEALKGSFIASVPASLGATALLFIKGDILLGASGNIIVNEVLWFTPAEVLIALFVVFVIGLSSMVFLIKISEKIPYWQFCIGLGVIATTAVLIGQLLA